MKEYTVKEIADLLGVSKTTVQKYVKKAGLSYNHIARNKQFYDYENAKIIMQHIKPDYDFTAFDLENSKNDLENSTTKSENSKTEVENSTTEDILLSMLQQEIEKKDQEIRYLREKLDKAYDQIADLANKAQYITAADKTAQIMDKEQKKENKDIIEPAAATDQDQEKEKKEVKKGFLTRLFDRMK